MITSPTRLAVRGDDREGAHVVEDVLGGDRLLPDPRFGEGHVFRDVGVEVMADHEHVEMLVDRVDRVGSGRVGRGGDDVRETADLDDVGGMAAAGPFGVERVDGAALEGPDRVLDEARLVERVGVDHHLHVVIVGDRETAVDGGRRRAPVLVQLERAGAGPDLLDQAFGARGVALAGQSEVHRESLGRLQHAADMPFTRGAGGGIGAGRRAGAAAEHGGDAARQRLLDLLRADEMDMRVEAAGGQDLAFAGNGFGGRPDDDRDPGLGVGVAGLADAADPAVPEPDIGLDDTPMVEDQRVGDDGVDGPVGPARLRLAHAVADDLAAAELDLLAIDRPILLDLEDEIGVGEAHPVARGRAVHVGIGGPTDRARHQSSPPMISWLKPQTARPPR